MRNIQDLEGAELIAALTENAPVIQAESVLHSVARDMEPTDVETQFSHFAMRVMEIQTLALLKADAEGDDFDEPADLTEEELWDMRRFEISDMCIRALRQFEATQVIGGMFGILSSIDGIPDEVLEDSDERLSLFFRITTHALNDEVDALPAELGQRTAVMLNHILEHGTLPDGDDNLLMLEEYPSDE